MYTLTWPSRLLLICVLAAFGGLFPLRSASAKKIMVISAHPDDESLMAAGIIRTAILNGDQVNVVIMTNGDGNGGLSMGYTRMQETVNAMGVLGVNENNVIFLGYPDGLLSPLYRYPTTPVTSISSGASSTYANRGLGRVDYHYYAFGVHGSYKGTTVLQDLTSLFQTFAPDEIYTHQFYDAHQDHDYTNQFIIQSVLNMRQQGSSFAPILYENIVHDQLTSTCTTAWPDYSQTWSPPTCLFSTSPLLPYRWSDITTFDVPPEMQTTDPKLNLKLQAFNQYVSQANNVGWGAYVKKNEWFWRRDIGHNLAPLAQVTVSSETSGESQYGVNAVDGTIDGDPRDLTKEWRAGTPNNGEWIKLTWASPQTVSQVVLYDRRNLTDNILAGTLSFSDGSTIAVGALPTNGASQIVNFAPKTVSWVMFTINSKVGFYTGLAEIEVYGPSTQLQAPPLTILTTSLAAGTVGTAYSQSLAATGGVLPYQWSVNSGGLSGGLTVNTNGTISGNPTQAATYLFTARVTDAAQSTNSRALSLTINPNGLTVSPTTMTPGGTVTATWAGITSPTAKDWIGLYASGAANGSFQSWVYVSCTRTPTTAQASGSCPFAVPASLTNGTYELRLFSNDGFTRLATSNPLTVAAAVVTRTLTVASSNPASGDSVTVSPNDNNSLGNGSTQFTRTYNNNTAVTLTAAATAGSNSFTSWNGCDTTSGTTCTVTMAADRTVTAAYTAPAAGSSLSVAPASVSAGGSVTASWSGIASPTAKDWIAVYASGAADGSYQNWSYVSCTRTPTSTQASGSCSLTAPSTSGSYEMRLFSNDGFTRLATSNQFTVAASSSSNLAPMATVQVSSENAASGQLGIKAIDGVIGGYPTNPSVEWVAPGQLAGAWIQLNWTTPQTVTKVVLYDRPNTNDNILSGTLSFSDGSSVAVGALPTAGSALSVTFAAKAVTWVRFTVNSASGQNTGLAEIQVFTGP